MAADNRTIRRQLFTILCNRFDLEDLRTLCFLLDVSYDSLRGEGQAAKARELIQYSQRRGLLSALVDEGKTLRPDVVWPDVHVSTPDDVPPPGEADAAGHTPRMVRAPAVPRVSSLVEKGKRLPSVLAPNESFEPEMVLIPAGEFLMGSDPKKDRDARGNEQPQHVLNLPDYCLAKVPLTNAQYLPFVQAAEQRVPEHWEDGKPSVGKENHPVVNVSWYDAVAYCCWLSEMTGRPYRLPSESEWEKGARGTEGQVYPWGDRWDAIRCNSAEGGKRDTTPVGAYPSGASPYGLLDMAGNVWEWTRSLWGRGYPYDWQDGRENLDAGGLRVVRGGAFSRGARYVRCAVHVSYGPGYRDTNLGFRVVIAPD